MAGLRKEEKRIGNARYTVSQLGYGDARPLLWLGASVLLPSLEALEGVRLIDDAGRLVLVELVTKDIGLIGKAARLFFERAKPDDFERVVRMFTERTLVQIDGAKGPVALASIEELHWPSRYGDFASWLAFSFEVHFGPFSLGGGEAAGSGSPGSKDP